MGRTLPTFRLLLERLAVEWSPYRRALRAEDRAAFDSLMNKARLHASSSSFMVEADPIDAVFMSMLVEQEKELLELRRRISGPEGPR